MIINLLDNTQSNSISIILTKLNIDNIDNTSHTLIINQLEIIDSRSIVNSKISILDNPPLIVAFAS